MKAKEELSIHVEKIFREYTTYGLHICDLATGGGKSYTISKLSSEYYLNYFDQIIIPCVQRKLVEGMKNELDKFAGKGERGLKPDDILVIENNEEVIKKGMKEDIPELLDNINQYINSYRGPRINHSSLIRQYKTIVQYYSKIKSYLQNEELVPFTDFINEKEPYFRKALHDFFEIYKKNQYR